MVSKRRAVLPVTPGSVSLVAFLKAIKEDNDCTCTRSLQSPARQRRTELGCRRMTDQYNWSFHANAALTGKEPVVAQWSDIAERWLPRAGGRGERLITGSFRKTLSATSMKCRNFQNLPSGSSSRDCFELIDRYFVQFVLLLRKA